MRALRIGLRTLAATVLLAVALAIGAALLFTAISRGWQRERVVAALASELGRQLGADVRIGALEGALYDGVVARGVVVTADDRPPLSIDALTLRFDLGPFLRERRLAIDSLVIEGLSVAIEQQQEQWLVSGVAKPIGAAEPASSEPFPLRAVEIREVELRDAHVLLTLDGGATRLDARLDGATQSLRWAPGEPVQLPPGAVATVALGPSVVDGRALDRAELAVRLADHAVEIEQGSVEGAFGRITLQGAARLASDALPPLLANARLDATVAALDLAALAAEPRLASKLDGTLHAEFAPDAPSQPGVGLLQANAELRAPRLGALDVDTLRLRGSIHTGTRAFALDELFAAGAIGEVRGQGKGAGGRVEAAELHADLRLERLPASWFGDAALAGHVKLSAKGSGGADDPQGRIDLIATELRRANSKPGHLVLRATAPGNRALRVDAFSFESGGLEVHASEAAKLRIEPGEPLTVVVEKLGLAFPGGELHARGNVASTALFGFRVDLDDQDLAATTAAFGLDAKIAGALHGQVTADGPFARPALRGSLTAEPFAFEGRRFERIEIALAPEAQRTLVTLHVHDGGAERLRLAARIATDALISEPGRLLQRGDTEVRIQADALETEWIAGALGRKPGEFGGRVDLDAVVRGAPRAPVVTGTLRLAGGRLAVDGLGEPLGPIDAELRLEGDTLRIESIHVPGGAGAIRASGTLALVGARPGAGDVQITVDGFELPKGSVATGRLDGALRLQGTWPAVTLDGRVALADAHIDVARRHDPVWREIRVHGLPGEEPVAEGPTPNGEGGFPAALLPASADVELVIPPDTRVQGNGADLRIAGDVRFLKHAGEEPLYLGGIRVVEGRYQFQNRRFEIERGTATLAGTRELDPEIDVVAVQKLREVTLRVVVSGRASAPNASLQSDPPLDPQDQLSYLAFGRPVSTLRGNDAAHLQGAATQVIGQLAFAGFGSELSGMIPLEAVHFEGDAERVGLTGSIAPGVYLRYSRDISHNDDRVGVEWQFRPRWTLRSEVGIEGNAGVDVIWSRDY